MAKIPVLPPKGMRDFLPVDFHRREHLIRTIRDTYESFGYEPIDTPAVERLDVLLGKGGGEADKLMYKVMKRGAELRRALDKGGELADMGLRYDLTVPFSRYYAHHFNELPKIFKRYHIGPVWRADRPQAGRYTEFYQCDLDAVGSDAALVEDEVILAVGTALERLGFTGYTIRLNHRELLSRMVVAAGVEENRVESVLITLDKLDKIGEEGVRAELQEQGVQTAASDRLFSLVNEVQGAPNDQVLQAMAAFTGEPGRAAVEQLSELTAFCPPLPGGELKVDPFLVRGMGYYTGPVFEVAYPDVPFSLGGGGRYDGLVGSFLGRPVPACGFSIGFERVYYLMEQRGMFPAQTTSTQLLVTLFDRDSRRPAFGLAQELRQAGFNVDLYPDTDKLPTQFKYAEKRGIPRALILGPSEIEAGTVTVRELATRQNETVPRAELIARLR